MAGPDNAGNDTSKAVLEQLKRDAAAALEAESANQQLAENQDRETFAADKNAPPVVEETISEPIQVAVNTLGLGEQEPQTELSNPNSAEQKLQYDQNTSGSGAGLTSGNTAAATANRHEAEKAENRKNTDNYLLSLSLEQLTAAFEQYDQAANAAIDNIYDITQDMVTIEDSIRSRAFDLELEHDEAIEQLDSLKEQLEAAIQDGNQEKIASLTTEVANQQVAVDFAKQNMDMHMQMADGIAIASAENGDAIDAIRETQQDLQAQLNSGDLTAEQREQISLQLAAGNEQIMELNQKAINSAQDVQKTAELSDRFTSIAQASNDGSISPAKLVALSSAMTVATAEGGISVSEMDKLIQMTRDDPELSNVLINMASQDGVEITTNDGQTLSGAEAGEYVKKHIEIDQKMADLAARIEQNPDDPALLAEKTALFEERYALEGEAMASLADANMLAAQNELDQSDQGIALTQANDAVDAATANTVNYYGAVIYQDEAGGYTALANDGRVVDLQNEPNPNQILADIKTQEAAGKTFGTAEIKNLQDNAAAAQANYDALAAETITTNSLQEEYGQFAIDKAAEERAASTDKNASETLVMAVPDYDLADVDASRNEALTVIETAALSGGTLSKEDYDKLAEMPGISPEAIDDIMQENKVELAGGPTADLDNNTGDLKNTASVVTNTATLSMFGVPFQTTPITITPRQVDQNNVYPAPDGGSFADSPQFAETSMDGPASYNEPVQNHAGNLTLETFTLARDNALEQQAAEQAAQAAAAKRALEQNTMVAQSDLPNPLTMQDPNNAGGGTQAG